MHLFKCFIAISKATQYLLSSSIFSSGCIYRPIFEGMDCGRGSLSVYSGRDASGQLLGRYCGRRLPSHLYSHSHNIYMEVEGITWATDINQLEISYEAFGGWCFFGVVIRQIRNFILRLDIVK